MAESVNNGSPKSQRSVERDRLLPIANITRIMRKAVPSNAKISKEARKTVQECVSEFVSFVTSEASEKCLIEKRQTITGDDLLEAMAMLGFDDYIDPLKLYLQSYRDGENKGSRAPEQSGNKDGGDSSGSSGASGDQLGSFKPGTN
ncbi:nuclear transcription factor Y subunit B-10-like isoform X2 [Tasmannia lanceolata]